MAKRGGEEFVHLFLLKKRITVAKFFIGFFFCEKKRENEIYTPDPEGFENKSNQYFSLLKTSNFHGASRVKCQENRLGNMKKQEENIMKI